MRTPDNAQVPGEGTATRSVGEGFGGVDPDEIEAYGQDFYEDYSDESSDDSFDEDEDDDSVTLDEDDIPTDGEMTEEEAEDILEDALEEEYGSQADEVVEDLEEDTGMSAIEILEDITGLDLDGSEESSYAASSSSDFDRQMAEAAELDGGDQTATADLFNEDMPSESDFDVNTDGHVDRDDLDDAAEGLGFHLGH